MHCESGRARQRDEHEGPALPGPIYNEVRARSAPTTTIAGRAIALIMALLRRIGRSRHRRRFFDGRRCAPAWEVETETAETLRVRVTERVGTAEVEGQSAFLYDRITVVEAECSVRRRHRQQGWM